MPEHDLSLKERIKERLMPEVDLIAERPYRIATCLGLGTAAGGGTVAKVIESGASPEIALPGALALSFLGLGTAAAIRRRNPDFHDHPPTLRLPS